jgi:hypothetical protein
MVLAHFCPKGQLLSQPKFASVVSATGDPQSGTKLISQFSSQRYGMQ